MEMISPEVNDPLDMSKFKEVLGVLMQEMDSLVSQNLSYLAECDSLVKSVLNQKLHDELAKEDNIVKKHSARAARIQEYISSPKPALTKSVLDNL